MVTPTNHVIVPVGFTLPGAPGTLDIFLPNIGEDQKKSYHLSIVWSLDIFARASEALQSAR